MAGLILRMAAATLGSGYLMHDDHFLVLEAAGSWIDGADYNDWFPWNQEGDTVVHPANFAYVGSQFAVLKVLHAAGIDHPSTQALIIRILHGLYGLFVIAFGYGIARALQPARTDLAVRCAWILAAGGLWPMLSVHQLVEVVCLPPLLLAFMALAHPGPVEFRRAVWAGIGIGLATGLRYQCGLIGLGLVPVLLWQRQWKPLLTIGTIALAVFAVTQAADLYVWGRPFTQLQAYLTYNSTHAGEYPQGPWYQYLLTLAGLLVPPVSLMLLWGAFHRGPQAHRGWWRILGPLLLFLVFHSLYANKQERFILPMAPALIVLGTLGWEAWSTGSRWWARHRRLERSAWHAFWVISLALLAATVPYPGKHSRVAAMEFLHDAGARYFAMVQVDSGAMPPLFYSGTWEDYHIDDRRVERGDPVSVTRRWCGTPPEFILFQGDRHLGEAVAEYKAALPGLRYVTTIKPGRVDRWLHELNPYNTVERIMVYATDDALPCP